MRLKLENEMHGMTYQNGTPHVWGKPCTKDEAPPLLDCFSQWRCPHCEGNLSGGAQPICLNACHLTAPQIAEFHDGLQRAARGVAKAHNVKLTGAGTASG